MKNISPFTEAKKDVREKNLKKSAAKGKPIRAVSNSDKDMLINSLANDDVFVATYYGKDNEVIEKNLRKNFLDSTKPMFKEMGIDKNDLEKVNTLTIPKECTTTGEDTTLAEGYPKPLTLITKKGKLVGCIKGYVSEDKLVSKLKEYKVLESGK